MVRLKKTYSASLVPQSSLSKTWQESFSGLPRMGELQNTFCNKICTKRHCSCPVCATRCDAPHAWASPRLLATRNRHCLPV